MAARYDALDDRLIRFISEQHVFFVATATADSRINLSPKGMDSLRVLGPRRIAWLNLTGSGNETAAHLQADPRMTLMFCSFGREPLILRIYGQARAIHRQDARWAEAVAAMPALPGARQVVELDIDLVQTSCGQAVPFYDFRAERNQQRAWLERLGEDGLHDYWAEANTRSLDGVETGILERNLDEAERREQRARGETRRPPGGNAGSPRTP